MKNVVSPYWTKKQLSLKYEKSTKSPSRSQFESIYDIVLFLFLGVEVTFAQKAVEIPTPIEFLPFSKLLQLMLRTLLLQLPLLLLLLLMLLRTIYQFSFSCL